MVGEQFLRGITFWNPEEVGDDIQLIVFGEGLLGGKEYIHGLDCEHGEVVFVELDRVLSYFWNLTSKEKLLVVKIRYVGSMETSFGLMRQYAFSWYRKGELEANVCIDRYRDILVRYFPEYIF